MKGPKPAHRRYSWSRLRNDFPDLPIWRAVARRAETRVCQVLAVVLRLECLANRSVPRGSVADMSIAEFAASLQLTPHVVSRIRTALQDPDIGWIDQDRVVDFNERNPDDCDPTAAERQRRRRAKLREERLRIERDHMSARGPPKVSEAGSRRDTVTSRRDVTPDQITSEKKEPAGVTAGPVDNCASAAGAAEKWLASEGLRIVAERMQEGEERAASRVTRWLKDLGQDAQALVSVLQAADRANYVAARFHNLVTDGIRRAAAAPRGQTTLPLGPVATRAGEKG